MSSRGVNFHEKSRVRTFYAQLKARAREVSLCAAVGQITVITEIPHTRHPSELDYPAAFQYHSHRSTYRQSGKKRSEESEERKIERDKLFQRCFAFNAKKMTQLRCYLFRRVRDNWFTMKNDSGLVSKYMIHFFSYLFLSGKFDKNENYLVKDIQRADRQM